MSLSLPSRPFATSLSALLLAFTSGCADDEAAKGDAEYRSSALASVKTYTTTHIAAMHAATSALCAAAPAPDADGWNANSDPAAVQTMRTEWAKARVAYEKVEGAIAVLFPDLDVALDERYDGFVATTADPDLFDDQIVTGMHAVERILWADKHPAAVIAFEKGLANYTPAAYPADAAQAAGFKSKLCARLVADTAALRDQFAPLALDSAAAYRGAVASLAEQVEKIEAAATGEEESRYAQHTLGDMRANLATGQAIYGYFRPWLLSKAGGAALDSKITLSFKSLDNAYAKHEGTALPAPPAGWSSRKPDAAALATPFGQLWQAIDHAADNAAADSLVSGMTAAGDLLGIAVLP